MARKIIHDPIYGPIEVWGGLTYGYNALVSSNVPDITVGCTNADFIVEDLPWEDKKCDWCGQYSTDDKYGGCSRCGGPRE